MNTPRIGRATFYEEQVLIRNCGITRPIFINQQTYNKGSTGAGVRAAQAAAVDTPNAIFVATTRQQFLPTIITPGAQ
jgi:hypothetical protein